MSDVRSGLPPNGAPASVTPQTDISDRAAHLADMMATLIRPRRWARIRRSYSPRPSGRI